MPSSRFQPSFAGGVLGPGLHGRIDINKYDIGLKVGKNVFIHAHGGLSNRAGTRFVAQMPNDAQGVLAPFQRDDDDTYVLVFSDQEMRLIQAGQQIQSGGVWATLTQPYTTAQILQMDFVQSIDVMYFAHTDLPAKKVSRSAELTWTWSDLALNPTVPEVTGLSASIKMTTTNTDEQISYEYRVAAVINGVEGFSQTASSLVTTPSDTRLLEIQGQRITLSWSAVTGAENYRVYRKRAGVFGYIGYTKDTSFVDDNVSPDVTVTPPVQTDLFQVAGDYPGKVTLFQQRLVLASSVNSPETIWMSRVGDFENFTRSEYTLDADRVELDITGSEVNKIRNMTQLRELVVFTSGGEFTITGPNGVMVATNPIQTQYGYSGSSGIKPLVVENTIVFVDSTGRQVRDLRYAFDQDGYTGNDLTIFSSHFFENRQIAGWAFQKNPHSIVWTYTTDGSLLSLTYKREHQLWAWTEHDIGGAVESICAVREGAQDAVYMIVNRTIGGQTRRYIERLDNRNFEAVEDAYFVDCGITYSGAATSTITGLDHLEGETVVALADGNVVDNLTVSSGQVSLPYAASKVHVGLPFSAEIETLPPPIDVQDVGSTRGRPIKASRLFVQLEKTRGIKAGPTSRRMTDLILPTSDLSETRQLFTGMQQIQLYADWNRDGTIVVRQDFPLPMTILGISPDYSIGRSA